MTEAIAPPRANGQHSPTISVELVGALVPLAAMAGAVGNITRAMLDYCRLRHIPTQPVEHLAAWADLRAAVVDADRALGRLLDTF